ncbi:MAG: hypothetical protein IJS15_14915 [Victivallales bacterium]|nr:hypothetical protein [Victivallales bacterium]
MIQEELIRSTIIPVIIKIISVYYEIPIKEAFQRFYTSKTAKCLADDDTGLYGQSPLFLASMFIEENDGTGNIDMTSLSRASSCEMSNSMEGDDK